MSKGVSLPTETTWASIVGMQKARDVVKANLTEVESDLTDARRELDELGSKDESSQDFQVAAARKERCLRVRDVYKERLKTLADKIDGAVAAAAKGENKLLDDFDAKLFVAKPKTEDLYHPAKSDDADGQLDLDGKPVRPVGRPGPKPKPEQPDASKGDGVDEHLNASVNELNITGVDKAALINAGFKTIGQVVAAAEKADNAIQEIARLTNVSEPFAKAIWVAVKKFRKTHRQAAAAAEKAAG